MEDGYCGEYYDRKTPRGVFLLLILVFAAAAALAVFLSGFTPEEDAFEAAWLRMLLGEENEKADVRVEAGMDIQVWQPIRRDRREAGLLTTLLCAGRRAALDEGTKTFWCYRSEVEDDPDPADWLCGGEPGIRAAYLEQDGLLAIWTDTEYAEYTVRFTELPTVTLKRAKHEFRQNLPETELFVQAEKACHSSARQTDTEEGILFSLWKAGKKKGIHLTAQGLCGLPHSSEWRLFEDGGEDELHRRVLYFDETGYRGLRLLECVSPVSR